MSIQPPDPPYYAVIFSSTRRDHPEYGAVARRMETLAQEQPGFLGLDSVSQGCQGVTISYWQDEASIAAWRRNSEHLAAQRLGREAFYSNYQLRVCKVVEQRIFAASD